MTFAHAWILHFLWMVPVVGLVLYLAERKRHKDLSAFADAALLPRLVPASGGMRFVKGLLKLWALACLILALAGPRWGSHYEEIQQKGVDILVLLDVSRSMLVSDLKPNRLEWARRKISDLLQVVQGDRVGFVAFSGAAFLLCPLTLDYGAIRMFLDQAGPDLIPVPGTDLGRAIETGLKGFDQTAETDRVMLLITDGEDHEQRGLRAAREAAEKGVRIFIIGIGDPKGGPVPLNDEKGGFRKDEKGDLIFSRLDEQGLMEMARMTGGRYVRSMTGDMDLDLIYFDGIRPMTTPGEVQSGKIRVYEERFYLFVLAAVLTLLAEGSFRRFVSRFQKQTQVQDVA